MRIPPPDRACATCSTATYCAGSPDEADQLAAFDATHAGHELVKRLPKANGDAQMGWTPGSGKPWPGGRS